MGLNNIKYRIVGRAGIEADCCWTRKTSFSKTQNHSQIFIANSLDIYPYECIFCFTWHVLILFPIVCLFVTSFSSLLDCLFVHLVMCSIPFFILFVRLFAFLLLLFTLQHTTANTTEDSTSTVSSSPWTHARTRAHVTRQVPRRASRVSRCARDTSTTYARRVRSLLLWRNPLDRNICIACAATTLARRT